VVRGKQHEVDLCVIRLRHELLDDAGERHDLLLVVHRKRMMCRDGDLQHERQHRQRRGYHRSFDCARIHDSSATLIIRRHRHEPRREKIRNAI
jgi:hypothetical protein